MISKIKKYKKAWEEFDFWIRDNYGDYIIDNEILLFSWSTHDKSILNPYDVFPVRDFYDYFDKLGILSEVGYDEILKCWFYCINIDYFLASLPRYFRTRQETEQALFIEMFKIREGQL